MDFDPSKHYQRGFSTLEILLAIAVMVFALSASAALSFSGQKMAADSQISSAALALAREALEEQRNLSKKDFRLVNPASADDGIFKKEITVESRPFFVKNVKLKVNWNTDGREQAAELSALITDYNSTAGNDTCDSNLSGDWTDPQIKKIINFGDYAIDASSTYAIGDVDAFKNKLYVSFFKTGNKTDPTFFVFDISNPSAPILMDKIDNATSTIAGINAITVNENYIYAASAGANQFQIIDAAAMPPKIIYNLKIIGGGEGESIFYKNGYVYLGLAKNGAVPEFYIFDVNNLSGVHQDSSYSIGSAVNSIYVKGGYAYLATADKNKEIIILDISDRAEPVFYGSYDVKPDQTNWGYGKSIEVIGDKMYFGRTYIANSPEFYIFDVSCRPIKLLGKYPTSNLPYSVNGLIIRNGLAFLAAGSGSLGGSLKLYDISSLENIAEIGAVPFPNGSSGSGGLAVDCEANNLYAASLDAAGKSYLTIITSR